MSNVRIKGRISTTTLKRGDERTVARTEQVDRMIEKGYVTVVSEETPAEPAPVEDVPEEATPPSRSASRQDWRDFLDSVGVKFDETYTRDELIALWGAEEKPADG